MAYLAALAVRLGQPERAARLSAALTTLSETMSVRPIPLAEAILSPALDEARRVLGEASFAAAQQAGRRMSLEEAVAEAFAIDLAAPPTDGPDAPAPDPPSRPA